MTNDTDSSPLTTHYSLLILQNGLHNTDRRGTDEDDEDSRENEENQGENQLHGRLGRLFFGDLPPPRPHGIGLHAEGLGDTGAETVGLNQDGRQAADVVHAGADPQVVEHLAAWAADLHLQI